MKLAVFRIVSKKQISLPFLEKIINPLDKSNYRDVSILSLISKVYNQLSEYTESFLGHILCGFRKAHSTQHELFKLLQPWQIKLMEDNGKKKKDDGSFVDAILIDLSKAYDCVLYELLISKVKCYGIENRSLRYY